MDWLCGVTHMEGIWAFHTGWPLNSETFWWFCVHFETLFVTWYFNEFQHIFMPFREPLVLVHYWRQRYHGNLCWSADGYENTILLTFLSEAGGISLVPASPSFSSSLQYCILLQKESHWGSIGRIFMTQSAWFPMHIASKGGSYGMLNS